MNDHDKIRKAMIALRQSYELLASLLPEERGAQMGVSLESEETVNKIRKVVTDVFGVDPCKKCQKNETVLTRHAYRYLLRYITHKTLKSIGLITNTVDHHSVVNSIKVCVQMMDSYKWYNSYMTECKARLKDEIEQAKAVKI